MHPVGFLTSSQRPLIVSVGPAAEPRGKFRDLEPTIGEKLGLKLQQTMWQQTPAMLRRLLIAAAAMLVLKVTLSVVIGYRSYLPPDFASDFLLGREAYFYGPYRWAFYAHLIAGPLSLLIGTVLASAIFARQAPRWHHRLGIVQMLVVLLVLVPSGLWMAPYAATGAIAGAGLGLLAIATAVSTALGWRAAIAREFAAHQRWMLRSYVLLCSAVVIRLLGGLAAVMHWDSDWYYPLAVWTSWVAPLLTCQVVLVFMGSPGSGLAPKRPVNQAPDRGSADTDGFPLPAIDGDGLVVTKQAKLAGSESRVGLPTAG